jgi:hypothetical protein
MEELAMITRRLFLASTTILFGMLALEPVTAEDIEDIEDIEENFLQPGDDDDTIDLEYGWGDEASDAMTRRKVNHVPYPDQGPPACHMPMAPAT